MENLYLYPFLLLLVFHLPQYLEKYESKFDLDVLGALVDTVMLVMIEQSD